MTSRSDIQALDGPSLGRAPLISLTEAGTLTNAIRTIRTLGRVPLASNLEALRARLTEETPSPLLPALSAWHCAACGLAGESYSHRDACFTHAEQRPDCAHEPVDGPPVIHTAVTFAPSACFDAMDEPDASVEIPEVVAGEMTDFVTRIDVLLTEALDRRGVGAFQVGVTVSC